MTEKGIDRNSILSQFMRIAHGDLELYWTTGNEAARIDPDFMAHFTAWAAVKSEVRDSKVAWPVVALHGLDRTSEHEYVDNALAHLMLLGPRELVRAYEWNRKLTGQGDHLYNKYRKGLQAAMQKYLRVREEKKAWWDKAVVSNRDAMLTLYAVSHTKPSARAQAILFDRKYPEDTVFAAIKNLRTMTAEKAAVAILEYGIPMPIAVTNAPTVKDPKVLLAVIEGMTPNQLLKYTNALKSLGVFNDPALRGAYDKAIGRAVDSKKGKTATLAAEKALEKVGEDNPIVAARIKAVQNAQLQKLGGIEGDWAVLVDCSGSMETAIEAGRRTASLIAAQAKGKLYFIAFSEAPRLFDLSGKTYDEILKATKALVANGGTSIGCGLDYLMRDDKAVQGIAIVSDGGDNHSPYFHEAYPKYCKALGIDPTVYFLHVEGQEADHLSGYCAQSHIKIEKYELGAHVDYNSLPGIVQLMRTNRYKTLDEIMATPLLTLAEVFAG